MTLGLVNDSKSYAEIKKQEERKHLEKLNLGEINVVDFPDDQYIRQQTKKNQIILHHTVSGQGAAGDISWWRQTAVRVGTQIIIDWKGGIYQCYSSLFWAYHIASQGGNRVALEKGSIGVELDAWGALIRHNRNWYPAKWDEKLNRMVANLAVAPIQKVQIYQQGFKGFYGFEKYTDEQIESLRKLLVYWNERYNIPLDYNEKMWGFNQRAYTGTPGIWAHTSYREDKSDCHPQPELIDMLKSLK